MLYFCAKVLNNRDTAYTNIKVDIDVNTQRQKLFHAKHNRSGLPITFSVKQSAKYMDIDFNVHTNETIRIKHNIFHHRKRYFKMCFHNLMKGIIAHQAQTPR